MSEDAQNPQPAPPPPPPRPEAVPAQPDPEIWMTTELIRNTRPPSHVNFGDRTPRQEQRSED